MNLRNLDQIQEQNPGGGGLPWGTLLLSAIAGGALVVVAMTTFSPKQETQQSTVDPLEELLREQEPQPKASRVGRKQVTFPGLLSDDEKPTTALAVVKDERGRLVAASSAEPPSLKPAPKPGSAGVAEGEERGEVPPAAHRPVGDLLSGSRVTQQPKDELTQLTADRVDSADSSTLAPRGQQGGYEIQVASFPSPEQADAFVEELRKRGHRAYRQAAYVPSRGLWHRVRIGSFKSRYTAQRYQKKLEKAERLSTFLVDPAKVKRQKLARDAKEKAAQRRRERRLAASR